MTRFDILVLLFLFMVGCITGWLMELFFNRFIGKNRKWINPGFLQGPYLPIYGFGTVILYILSYILNTFTFKNIIIDIAFIFIVASLLMTLLELVGGLFFKNVMHIKLWDYSNEKFNYKGIICLRFSLLWGAISILYYFLINPSLTRAVSLYTSHIEFSFIVGVFYGFILIDLFETMKVSSKIRKLAKESELIIAFKDLKSEAEKAFDKRSFFMLPDRKDIRSYIEELKDRTRDRNDH